MPHYWSKHIYVDWAMWEKFSICFRNSNGFVIVTSRYIRIRCLFLSMRIYIYISAHIQAYLMFKFQRFCRIIFRTMTFENVWTRPRKTWIAKIRKHKNSSVFTRSRPECFKSVECLKRNEPFSQTVYYNLGWSVL